MLNRAPFFQKKKNPATVGADDDDVAVMNDED